MVSTTGRYARITQAHKCPVQRRLKVRYSQLVHFDPCTQETMDLFVSWLLSRPLTNKGIATDCDGGTPSITGDTVPSVKATTSPPPGASALGLATERPNLLLRSVVCAVRIRKPTAGFPLRLILGMASWWVFGGRFWLICDLGCLYSRITN
jgi:hypothetical protein